MDLKKTLELDVSGAFDELARLTAQINDLTRVKPKLDFDTTPAVRSIELVNRRLKEISDKAVEITANVNDSEIVALQGLIDDLSSESVTIDTTIDDSGIRSLLADLDGGVTAEVQIGARLRLLSSTQPRSSLSPLRRAPRQAQPLVPRVRRPEPRLHPVRWSLRRRTRQSARLPPPTSSSVSLRPSASPANVRTVPTRTHHGRAGLVGQTAQQRVEPAPADPERARVVA